MISVVTPWRTLLSALGLIGSVKSECVLMSMKPGATARPAASMVFAAGSSSCGPIAAMRPSADGEIGRHARTAAAVEQQPAADQDVMHGIASDDVPVSIASRRAKCEEAPIPAIADDRGSILQQDECLRPVRCQMSAPVTATTAAAHVTPPPHQTAPPRCT